MSRKTRVVRERGIGLAEFAEALVFVGQERPSIFHVVYEKGRFSSRPEHVIKKSKILGYHPVRTGKRKIHNGRKK